MVGTTSGSRGTPLAGNKSLQLLLRPVSSPCSQQGLINHTTLKKHISGQPLPVYCNCTVQYFVRTTRMHYRRVLYFRSTRVVVSAVTGGLQRSLREIWGSLFSGVQASTPNKSAGDHVEASPHWRIAPVGLGDALWFRRFNRVSLYVRACCVDERAFQSRYEAGHHSLTPKLSSEGLCKTMRYSCPTPMASRDPSLFLVRHYLDGSRRGREPCRRTHWPSVYGPPAELCQSIDGPAVLCVHLLLCYDRGARSFSLLLPFPAHAPFLVDPGRWNVILCQPNRCQVARGSWRIWGSARCITRGEGAGRNNQRASQDGLRDNIFILRRDQMLRPTVEADGHVPRGIRLDGRSWSWPCMP